MKIYLNNEQLLSGGETSCKVIYNNLIGINFSGKEYENYIKSMEIDFKVKIIKPNAKLELLYDNDDLLRMHTF